MKSETNPSPLNLKETKGTIYDKRLIKKIVKEIEEDMPRSEAMATYGMSPKTLSKWLQTYASPAYLSKNNRRVLKDSEKRTVVRTVESGMSLKEAEIAFGIPTSSIKYWIAKFAKNDDLAGCKPVFMPKRPTDALTSDEVRALQKALAEEKLKVAGLNTLIDIAEEHLKIDIRKKSGAKQSSK
jgi:transposase